MNRKALLPLCAALVALTGISGCGMLGGDDDPAAKAAHAPAADSSGSSAAKAPYDVTGLLHPDKEYFGVAVDGAPSSMKPVDAFAGTVGKKPNLVGSYSAWGDGFNAPGARNVFDDGGMLYVSWEPFKPGLDKIADGSQDAYIKKYAESVRTTDVPVAISFGHEMNGHWYPWGTKKTTPETFVAAWKHIHDVFQEVGATNVIWVWSPNVVNPVRSVQLKPYWPGDAYVDWVGIVGYWTTTGAHTFDTLYGPSRRQIEGFTDKPVLISETSAEPGDRRRADVRALLDGVRQDDDVIGFLWFNIPKRADWRIQSSPLALAEFKRLIADDAFGFEVPRP
ncbi:glycoside hydrolase family 26 protein [Streptomyces longispororuber]|uniref:glycoside hydrolase family 26 protein n=1 Tax=Streptomyces longispororuber TaxID=68230 RepID=UPI00210C5E49|nr:glycosyl hydrolase [Streptomyces longispororuber]MCQ4210016.1 beta-mannanase [Streptomyces longispororuber]